MNIGEAATLTGIPRKTIRYYEKIGLVLPQRSLNGYRHFGRDELAKLTVLAKARELGFPIKDCRALLELHESHRQDDGSVEAMARRQLDRIDDNIEALRQRRHRLSELISACSNGDRTGSPILGKDKAMGGMPMRAH